MTLCDFCFICLLFPILNAPFHGKFFVNHPYYPVCWLINIRDSVFLRFLYCQVAPIISYRFYQSFFNFPPVSCLSLSLFTFHSTLHPSWLPSASLLYLPVCFLSPCVASVLCGCTDESDWSGECAVLPTTIPQHRTRTHRTSKFSAPFSAIFGVSDREFVLLQPLYLPPIRTRLLLIM